MFTKKSNRIVGASALAMATLLASSGCDNAGEGALGGAAVGALGGLAIGSLSGNAGAGAAIGAVAGGATGAVIGDQNRRKEEQSRRAAYGNGSYERGYDEGYDDGYSRGFEQPPSGDIVYHYHERRYYHPEHCPHHR